MDLDGWMGVALEEARLAGAAGEIPVGAVVVRDNQLLGRGHNRRERDHDPTAHAEIMALRAAAQSAQSWDLSGSELLVTLEPCLMCAGAIRAARVSRVYYGADDERLGVRALCPEVWQSRYNMPAISVFGGVREEESRSLLDTFFARLRQEDGVIDET